MAQAFMTKDTLRGSRLTNQRLQNAETYIQNPVPVSVHGIILEPLTDTIKTTFGDPFNLFPVGLDMTDSSRNDMNALHIDQSGNKYGSTYVRVLTIVGLSN